MATAVAEARRRLNALYAKAWHNAGLGPDDNERPKLTLAEINEYRQLVRYCKRVRGYSRLKVRASTGAVPSVLVNAGRCEHCLYRRTVMLVQPGTVSGSMSGDWVCGRCDARVGGLIMIRQLSRLVLEDSAS